MKTLTAAALALALTGTAWSGPGAAAPGPAAGSAYLPFQLVEAGFRCEVPRAWEQRRDPRQDARQKVYGLTLLAPQAKGPVRPSITVDFYSAGNRQFKDAEAFLKSALSPAPVPVLGEKTSPLRELRVAGAAARSFTRDTVEVSPPMSMQSKEEPVREEYVVLSRPRGFFVLRYRASTADFARERAAFKRLLETFKTTAD